MLRGPLHAALPSSPHRLIADVDALVLGGFLASTRQESTENECRKRRHAANQKALKEDFVPKRNDIHKILIIGSGPIIIGQACEFDYSGTQACKALRKLGYHIILVNSNPATIMTDPYGGRYLHRAAEYEIAREDNRQRAA